MREKGYVNVKAFSYYIYSIIEVKIFVITKVYVSLPNTHTIKSTAFPTQKFNEAGEKD